MVLSPVMVGVNSPDSVTVTLAVPVQPLASVAVTTYVPEPTV